MNHRDRDAHVHGFTCGYISRGHKPAKQPFPWGALIGYLIICAGAAQAVKMYL